MLGDSVELVDASTGGEALAALAQSSFDGVLLDNRLPDYTAVELLPLLGPQQLRVLVMSSLNSVELTAATAALGAHACVDKNALSAASLQALITAQLAPPSGR